MRVHGARGSSGESVDLLVDDLSVSDFWVHAFDPTTARVANGHEQVTATKLVAAGLSERRERPIVGYVRKY